jgi:hypothetical protein
MSVVLCRWTIFSAKLRNVRRFAFMSLQYHLALFYVQFQPAYHVYCVPCPCTVLYKDTNHYHHHHHHHHHHRTPPDRLWGPLSLLHCGQRVALLGVKRRGRGFDHPPPTSVEVEERIELYLYSPSGPSWPLLGGNLPFLPLSLLVESGIGRDEEANTRFLQCSSPL